MPVPKLNLDQVNAEIELISNLPDIPSKGFQTFSLLRDIADRSEEFTFWVKPPQNKNVKECILDKRFDYLNMLDIDNSGEKDVIVNLFLENMYDKTDKINLNKWKVKGKTREVVNVFYTGGLPIIPLLNYNIKVSGNDKTSIRCNVSLCNPNKRNASIKNKHELINNNLHVIVIKNTTIAIVNNVSGAKNSHKYPSLQELVTT